MPTLMVDPSLNHNHIGYLKEDLEELLPLMIAKYKVFSVLGLKERIPNFMATYNAYFAIRMHNEAVGLPQIIYIPVEEPMENGTQITASIHDKGYLERIGLEKALRDEPITAADVREWLKSISSYAKRCEKDEAKPESQCTESELDDKKYYEKEAAILLQIYKGLTGNSAKDLPELIQRLESTSPENVLVRLLSFGQDFP